MECLKLKQTPSKEENLSVWMGSRCRAAVSHWPAAPALFDVNYELHHVTWTLSFLTYFLSESLRRDAGSAKRT